uniref:Uncharacterized protein n=1 Tax=Sphaerodactylus townsendi TaxID=933632 RepID=A0ACB8GBN4_9SAUR
MKLVSWNVNGLWAGPGPAGLQWLLEALDAGVVCLQETKITRESWRGLNHCPADFLGVSSEDGKATKQCLNNVPSLSRTPFLGKQVGERAEDNLELLC